MTDAVKIMYAELLRTWNSTDAAGFASAFTEDGEVIGFDGSILRGRDAISADHRTGTYVGIVREVVPLTADVAVARAVAGDGVSLNSLLTGQIATERLYSLRGGPEAAEEAARQTIPAGRPGTPEEMAAAAVFLCSTRAAFITGEAVRVDGGAARAV